MCETSGDDLRFGKIFNMQIIIIKTNFPANFALLTASVEGKRKFFVFDNLLTRVGSQR